MTAITMAKLEAYTAAVVKVSEAADRCAADHRREHARAHLRLSLAFYQAVVTTPDEMMRAASFKAAVLELYAASEHVEALKLYFERMIDA